MCGIKPYSCHAGAVKYTLKPYSSLTWLRAAKGYFTLVEVRSFPDGVAAMHDTHTRRKHAHLAKQP